MNYDPAAAIKYVCTSVAQGGMGGYDPSLMSYIRGTITQPWP